MSITESAWIYFNGKYSYEYDVVVNKLPILSVAQERIESYEIPGRDGNLHFSDDTYSQYTTNCEMTMLDAAQRSSIWVWLKGGMNSLVSSDDPTKVVKARVVNKIDPSKIDDDVKEFLVVFECQPFRYEQTPTVHTVLASGNITNPGTRWSQPKIVVTGTGEITINGTVITISESGVTIDSELQECYAGTTSKNDKMSGDFPTLDPGVNAIVLGAGITKLVITGNYRWY